MYLCDLPHARGSACPIYCHTDQVRQGEQVAPEDNNSDAQRGAYDQSARSKVPPVLSQRVPNQYPLDLNEAENEAENDAKNESEASASSEKNPNGVHVYDLFKNLYCVATLGFLAVLIAYYIIDSLPLGESYVAGMPYGLFVLAGVACAVPVLAANHLGGVPRAITAGLALTAGVVGMLAAYPALLRVNAMTDTGEIQVVEYMRMTRNHFAPVGGDWPAIEMIGGQYWTMMSGDVSRTIPIRRGGLGFYQADLTAIRFELELGSTFASAD